MEDREGGSAEPMDTGAQGGKTTRRGFLQKVIGLGVGAELARRGLGALADREVDWSKEEPDLEEYARKVEQDAESVDEAIEHMRGALADLETKLRERLQYFPENLKDRALAPFLVFQENLANPDRNLYATLLRSRERVSEAMSAGASNRPNADTNVIPAREGGFTFGYTGYSDTLKNHIVFRPNERLLDMDTRLSGDLIETLSLYRSLVRVIQDNVIRQSLKSDIEMRMYFSHFEPASQQEYYGSFGHKAPRNIVLEYEATLLEILALNALSDDRLRQDVMRGLDRNTYYRQLQPEVSMMSPAWTRGSELLDFAEILYKSGEMTDESQRALYEALRAKYQKEGYSVTEWNSIDEMIRVSANQASKKSSTANE